MLFHLRQGKPVIPSKISFRLYSLDVRLENALVLEDFRSPAELGLDISVFGRLSYFERAAEYPRTQEIGEVAHCRGFDGLVVPRARSDTSDVIPFCDSVANGAIVVQEDVGPVDWTAVG